MIGFSPTSIICHKFHAQESYHVLLLNDFHLHVVVESQPFSGGGGRGKREWREAGPGARSDGASQFL